MKREMPVELLLLLLSRSADVEGGVVVVVLTVVVAVGRRFELLLEKEAGVCAG